MPNDPQKICRACRHQFPNTDQHFSPDARTRDGLSKLCRSCESEQDSATYKRNIDYQRDYHPGYRARQREARDEYTRGVIAAAKPLHIIPPHPDPDLSIHRNLRPAERATITRLYGTLNRLGYKTFEQVKTSLPVIKDLASRHQDHQDHQDHPGHPANPSIVSLGAKSLAVLEKELEAVLPTQPTLTPQPTTTPAPRREG